MKTERSSLMAAMVALVSGICAVPACHPKPTPTFAVAAGMQGASAGEVESLLTQPLEAALTPLPGVVSLHSESRRDGAIISVTFAAGTDSSVALALVQHTISNCGSSLPDHASAPVVTRLGGTGEPLLRYTLASDAMTSAELRELNDEVIRPALERVPGVAEVDVCGGATREVNVNIDAARLAATGVAAHAFLAPLARSATAALGGKGDYRELPELSRIVVAGPQGMPVRLSDVASVSMDAAASACGAHDGKGPVVEGEARGQVGADALTIVRAVTARLAEVSRKLPPGCRLNGLRSSMQSSFELSISTWSSAAHRTRIGAAVAGRLARIVGDPSAVLLRSRWEWPNRLEVILENGAADRVLPALADIPGVDVVPRADDRAVRVRLMGNDLELLDRTATEMRDAMRRAHFVTAVALDGLLRTPEMTVHLDRKRLAAVGVSAMDVAEALQMAKGGVPAGWFRHGATARVPIRLRAVSPNGDRATKPDELLALTVPTSSGTAVPLSSLAEVRMGSEPALIVRENSQRAVTVRVALKDGSKPTRQRLRELAQATPLPAGVTLVWLDRTR